MDGMANYAPIGPELEGVSEGFPLSSMVPSFGEYFPAQAGNALRDSGTSAILRSVELAGADTLETGGFDEFGVFQPTGSVKQKRVSAEYAKAQADSAGVSVAFDDTDYSQGAVDLMIDRAKRRAVRDETVSAYDPNILTSLGVSVAATLVDPVNVASAFIPFVGEARYAGLLAGRSGFGGRTLVRAGAGAVEGLGGAALLEPAIFAAATQEGRDYSLADSLNNLAFGAAFGAGLHMGGGAFAEKIMGRTYANAPIVSPPDLVDRLPYEAKVQALKSAIADLHEGRGVQTQDVIDQLTQLDPELGKAVLYAQTLRRDGPSIDDTEARIAFWEGKLQGKRKTTGKVESFAAWVRSKGGVRDIDGALEAQLGKGHGLPASMFMTQRGSKRSARGVDFEQLYLDAVNEGFVVTKQEFIDAFRGHAGGVVAPVIRRADSEAATAVAEEAEYIAAAIAQAGINPKASVAARARAITGREQHVIAAERARVQSALTRLEARREAILKGEPIAEPKPDENKPEPEKLPTETEQTIEAGDTVETVGSKEFTLSGGEGGVKVTKVYDDPVYGKWAMVEGSNSAIKLDELQLKKKDEKPADTLSAAVAEDQKPKPKAETAEIKPAVGEDGQATYTDEQIILLIAEAFATTKGAPISAQVLSQENPGLSVRAIKRVAEKLRKSDDLKAMGEHEGQYLLHRHDRTTDMDFARKSGFYEEKIEQARRNLDALYPSMAAQRTYYLKAIQDQNVALELGQAVLQKNLNKGIREKTVRAFDEETGAELGGLESRYFDIDQELDQGGVLLVFKDDTKVSKRLALRPSLFPEPTKAEANAPQEHVIPKEAQPMRLEEKPVEGSLDGELDMSVIVGGVEVAKLKVVPQPIDKTLYVDNLISAKGVNKLGASAMRDLIDALADRFPGYTTIKAYRMTGARGKSREAGGRPKMEMELPLKKRTPEEKNTELTGEALAAAGPRTPMPDTPQAERAALTSKELGEAVSQAQALEAKTLKRLDSLIKTMSPETAATIRAQLAKIDGDSKDLAAVYESAVQCLLKP